MYLFFDIGGTNMRIAVSSDGKTLTATKTILTPKDFNQGIQHLKQAADELSQGQKIQAIAGGVAVVFDGQRQTLIKSAHLPNWVGKPLLVELKRMFDCPIFLQNEAALEGLGEAVLGSGKDKKLVVLITVGTGVGGVKIVNGRFDDNLLGFEPGHQIIVPDGEECTCGGKGHLEAYVGGSYLEKRYGQKAKNIKDPQIWDRIAKYLAIGLYNSSVHWSPEVIILGGSVVKSIPLESVRNYLQEFSTIFPQMPELKLVTLGDEAGLIGALEYLKQQM